MSLLCGNDAVTAVADRKYARLRGFFVSLSNSHLDPAALGASQDTVVYLPTKSGLASVRAAQLPRHGNALVRSCRTDHT